MKTYTVKVVETVNEVTQGTHGLFLSETFEVLPGAFPELAG